MKLTRSEKTDGVYSDKIAAQDVLGTTKKANLNESPFIQKTVVWSEQRRILDGKSHDCSVGGLYRLFRFDVR